MIIATDASTVHKLLPGLKTPKPQWRSVTTLYFAADVSPINEAIICLNGSGLGQVNSVSALSDVVPGYAPSGKALLSVVVLGMPEADAFEESVREELVSWFGPTVRQWRYLHTDRTQQALPEQLPDSGGDHGTKGFQIHNDIWICGDHLRSASIEGAVVSGKKAAESVMEKITREIKQL